MQTKLAPYVNSIQFLHQMHVSFIWSICTNDADVNFQLKQLGHTCFTSNRQAARSKAIFLLCNASLLALAHSHAPALYKFPRCGEMTRRKEAACTCMCAADESVFEFATLGKSCSKYRRLWFGRLSIFSVLWKTAGKDVQELWEITFITSTAKTKIGGIPIRVCCIC